MAISTKATASTDSPEPSRSASRLDAIDIAILRVWCI